MRTTAASLLHTPTPLFRTTTRRALSQFWSLKICGSIILCSSGTLPDRHWSSKTVKGLVGYYVYSCRLKAWRRKKPKLFTISEPQNPSIAGFYAVRKWKSDRFQCRRLGKVRSGHDRLEGQQWCRKSAATVFFFLPLFLLSFLYMYIYTNSRWFLLPLCFIKL